MYTRKYKVNRQKVHYVKFDKDTYLLESLTEYAIKNNIKTAEISFIGAVQNLNVVYFNQKTKEYEDHFFEGGFEVLSGLGNITLFENKPLVHIHISVSDKDGKAFGGHLVNGTKIWLIEAIIKQPTFIGKNYINRYFDEELCLNVWND